MKAQMILLSLALTGCFRPAEAVVISSEFSPKQQGAIVEALEEWFELEPGARLPYAIHDEPTGGEAYLYPTKCEENPEEKGPSAMTELRMGEAPRVWVCTKTMERNFNAIILHELGHVLALSREHTETGIMQPVVPDEHVLNDDDRAYLGH